MPTQNSDPGFTAEESEIKVTFVCGAVCAAELRVKAHANRKTMRERTFLSIAKNDAMFWTD